MTAIRSMLCVLLATAVALGGCVAQDGEPAEASPSPSSTVSVSNETLTADVGDIQGTVTDDESAPIAGVSVVIHGTEIVATTDEAGGYGFTGVEVGTYDILTHKLGFANGAQKAEVLAGETVYVNFTLGAIVIAPDPYQTVTTHEGLITCGAVLVPWCGVLDEAQQEYGTPNPTGEHWLFRWAYGHSIIPTTVVFELVWQPSVPGTAPTLTMLATQGFSGRADGASVLKLVIDGSEFKEIAENPEEVFGIGVYPGVEPVLNQRFTLYRTDFFHGEAPEDYSVLTTG